MREFPRVVGVDQLARDHLQNCLRLRGESFDFQGTDDVVDVEREVVRLLGDRGGRCRLVL